MWNDLPFNITSAQSLAVFRQRLKTFLFSRSYPDILIWLIYRYWLLSLFFSGIFHGPCNNWHYLDHVKHVDDGDDDDDALAEGGVARSVNKSRPSLSEAMLDYVPVKWLVIIGHVNRSFYLLLLTYSHNSKCRHRPPAYIGVQPYWSHSKTISATTDKHIGHTENLYRPQTISATKHMHLSRLIITCLHHPVMSLFHVVFMFMLCMSSGVTYLLVYSISLSASRRR